MGQGAAQVFGQRGAVGVSKGAGVLQLHLEVGSGLGQSEGLQLGGLSVRVLAQQHKIAGVGDQHQPVSVPVAADLRAVGGEQGILVGRLDLHYAALRRLAGLGLPALRLLGGVETEIGMPRSLLGQLADAIHLGPQRAAHGVQQIV